ncbi:MAG: FtsW/RodA/SpoVE family cell cycle protein [Aquificaceae bacterium]
MDRWTLYPVFALFIVGETALISSNVVPYIFDKYKEVSIYKKPIIQLITFLLGLFLADRMAKRFDYRVLKNKKIVYALVLMSTTSLFFVVLKKYLMHIPVNRWIVGTSLQPLEFAKLALVIFVAYYIVEKGTLKEWRYLFWASFIVLINAFLIFLQPDKGGAIFILLVAGIIFYVGGVPKRVYIPIIVMFGLFILYILTSKSGYVQDRLSAWKDPFADPDELGYQIVQSLFGLAHGGFFGVGIGQGVQKMGSLPVADTDYIISLVGEEFGFIGLSSVMLLYSLFIGRLFYYTYRTRENFGKLTLFGISLNFSLSFFYNTAMAVNLLPPKGIALPLLSYGASNLLFSLISLGLAQSIINRNRL